MARLEFSDRHHGDRHRTCKRSCYMHMYYKYKYMHMYMYMCIDMYGGCRLYSIHKHALRLRHSSAILLLCASCVRD